MASGILNAKGEKSKRSAEGPQHKSGAGAHSGPITYGLGPFTKPFIPGTTGAQASPRIDGPYITSEGGSL